MTATPAAQFWLMTGEVPSGPFTVEQVHAEVAAGRATWQTLACPVGTADTTWRPLVQTAGIGPLATPGGSAEQSVPGDTNPPASQPVPSGEPEPPIIGRRSSPIAQVGAWVAAAVLVGGAYFGVKWLNARNFSQPPVVPPTGSGIQKLLTSPPPAQPGQSQPTAPTSGIPGWNLGGPPVIPAYMQDPKALLVGSWRWDGGGGYASTFAFEAAGTFTYSVTGANAVLNVPVVGCEASGRWSVRDGTLFVEFTGASEAALVPVFRGRTAKAQVKFVDTDRVQLAGIEGDAVARTYTRVR
jgi:hypothetical protein